MTDKNSHFCKAPALVKSAGALLFLTITLSIGFLKSPLASAQDEVKPNIKAMTSKQQAEEVVTAPESINSSINLHSLGLGIAQTFLKGDFKDNGDDSITFDLLYNYSASHTFDLLINAHHSEHKIGAKRVYLNGIAPFIKAKFFQFDSFSPFVGGGLGFYLPIVKRELNGALTESKSKLVFGTNLGAGAELRLNRNFIVGTMGQIHNPFDAKQETAPEVEGSYYKLMIYLLYTF